MSRATTLNGGGGTIDTASSTTPLTRSGDIGGAGDLTKSGVGTLVLAGTSSCTGGDDGPGRRPAGHDHDPDGRHHRQRQCHLRPEYRWHLYRALSGSGSLTKRSGAAR